MKEPMKWMFAGLEQTDGQRLKRQHALKSALARKNARSSVNRIECAGNPSRQFSGEFCEGSHFQVTVTQIRFLLSETGAKEFLMFFIRLQLVFNSF